MQPESLVQLIGSGNSAVVEQAWMHLVESDGVLPSTLLDYTPVLEALCKAGKREVAAEYAWSALESLSDRHAPRALIKVAGPFLRAVGDDQDLRAQVAELYRRAYADVAGLELLIKQAGLIAGRPVRRALRTLEVCLPRQEGDYLASRDDDGAARIEAIDRTEWQFTIDTGEGVEALAAVHLADAYAPATPSDFHVLRRFAPEQLLARLQEDPAAIVIELCKRSGSKITREQLEQLLVPDPLSEADWKKWWTRARTGLRKQPNVELEGRPPYTVSYLEYPVKLEDKLWTSLQNTREPTKQIELVENYLRECRAYGASPSNEILCRCHEFLSKVAARAVQARSEDAIIRCTVAAQVGVLGDAPCPDKELSALLKDADNVEVMFEKLDSEVLVDAACKCLTKTRCDDWPDLMLALLPLLPQGSCARIASQLIQAGRPVEDFHPVVARILSNPLAYFGALLWLWDKSEDLPLPANAQSVSVLIRILRALEEARLSDSVSRNKLSNMKSSVRSSLLARKYERFEACLAGMDAGMAGALRNQLGRAHTLGRAVREDLLKRLSKRFPRGTSAPEKAPWDQNDVLFVTAAGLRRKQDEIGKHVNVKMAENARAIGRAAERGDLSENSEHRFALEERDLLRARLAQMNAEMAQAQVVDPADIPTDYIGVGTKAVFRRTSDGQRYEMSFFGPWEASAEMGMFNYRAPLAKSLMGKRIGDVVVFDHTGAQGTYELIELQNPLAPPEEQQNVHNGGS